MKELKNGFLFAIGWVLGTATMKVASDMMLKVCNNESKKEES